MSRNRLSDATSPYLLQHADNPVHWQQWGPDALKAAADQDKPILLSVGYAACHWCHVMAHESFENEETAAVMNAHFINVKVDREERPDLDSIYQYALGLLGQQGGWPLTMFLTPDGAPFWGGTYFPPDARWGRPGFADVLRRVTEIYHGEKDKVDTNRAALHERLMDLSKSAPGQMQPEVLDRAADKLLEHFDPVHGGLSGAPKFPQGPAVDFLWRAHLRTGRDDFARAVILTMDHLCEGGIYDHLGGGVARYAVDETWLVPHFEKMLYDNALFVEQLTHLWRETGRDLYRRRICETVDWLLREMVTGPGAFASSLDADSEGVEGKFYVWDKAEIDAVLGPDSDAFCREYGVTSTGNWEGKNILNRLHRLTEAPAGTDDTSGPAATGDGTMRSGGAFDEETLGRLKSRLLESRSKRIRPALDDKILADWNGMMIRALTEAAMVLDRPDWLAAACRAYDVICDVMMAADGGLVHSWRDGKRQEIGLLDDYAFMARAALGLYEATGKTGFVDQARNWCDHVERHFLDGETGGYFQTADDVSDLLVRPKNGTDGPQPSANAIMVESQARLHHLTGDAIWHERAERTVAAFIGAVSRLFYPLIGLMNGYDSLINRIDIGVLGDPASPGTASLLKAVWSVSLPTRSLQLAGHADDLPEAMRAGGRQPEEAALVCAHQTCSKPLTDPKALSDDLRRRRSSPAG